MIWKVQMYHYQNVDSIMACEGPNEDPIATPSICLYDILLNIKYVPFVTK